MITEQAQEQIANTSTGVSVGAFGISWLPFLTDIAQLGALVVTIAVGIIAGLLKYYQLKKLKKDQD